MNCILNVHNIVRNIMCLQNSSYYWGFAAFVAYFNNHPLYTPPGGDFTSMLSSQCITVLLLLAVLLRDTSMMH